MCKSTQNQRSSIYNWNIFRDSWRSLVCHLLCLVIHDDYVDGTKRKQLFFCGFCNAKCRSHCLNKIWISTTNYKNKYVQNGFLFSFADAFQSSLSFSSSSCKGMQICKKQLLSYLKNRYSKEWRHSLLRSYYIVPISNHQCMFWVRNSPISFKSRSS